MLGTGRFLTSKLPLGEQENANKLKSCFDAMELRITELQDAIELFGASMRGRDQLDLKRDQNGMPNIESMKDYTFRANRYLAWATMGARCGAMAIYSFDVLKVAANSLADKCPTIQQYRDHSAKKHSKRIFNQYFPNFAGIRHHAAHPGELAANEWDKHSLKDGLDIDGVMNVSGPVFISGAIFNDHYTCTFMGQKVAYHLHPDSVAKLSMTLQAYLKSFDPLVEHHMQQL